MNNQVENNMITSKSNIYSELRELASLLTSVIEDIKISEQSITESYNPAPNAPEQFEKITKHTENASHQLLDASDSISDREAEIAMQLKELRKVLPATYFRNNSRVKRVMDEIKSNISANQDDLLMMMNVLQFQNVTAQQTTQAISLLDQVENRLQAVLQKYDNRETHKQEAIT